MKDMCSILTEWGCMVVICFACAALVYQEHTHSCHHQIQSAKNIKDDLNGRLKKCCKFFSISNWPLCIILLIIYATTIYYFQTLPIAIGGFFVSIVIYQMVGICLQQNYQIGKLQAHTQAHMCNYVRCPQTYNFLLLIILI